MINEVNLDLVGFARLGFVQHQLALVLRVRIPPGARKANDALLAPGLDHPPIPLKGALSGQVT